MGELLDAIVEEVLRLIPAQRALLLLKRENELVPRVIYPPLRQEVVISSTIVRKALEAGEVVLTRDARLEIGGTESIISANIRSALCAPLLVEQGAIGLIYLDSPGRDRFGSRERDLLAAIANQAAVTIERARLTEELRKQEASRQLFERFVSPSVARDVASYFSEHGRLREPQELIVSVLFADVKGFSSLSERLSPREVQDLLNEYLHEMTEVIFQHNGTLDKYIGDGIMAIFGAPQVNEYQDYHTTAIQAVDAALDMIEAHRRLIEKLDPSKAFDFRIGINTGPVYAGFFGTRQRLEYTVIGDTVNTAARLENRADLNSVLISEATRNAIGDAFILQEMGDYQLKGKAQTRPYVQSDRSRTGAPIPRDRFDESAVRRADPGRWQWRIMGRAGERWRNVAVVCCTLRRQTHAVETPVTGDRKNNPRCGNRAKREHGAGDEHETGLRARYCTRVYQEEHEVVMPVVVGIRFKDSGKTYYFDPNGIEALSQGDHVIVETVRGPELAKGRLSTATGRSRRDCR
jgi:class 3 adenylate cyclase